MTRRFAYLARTLVFAVALGVVVPAAAGAADWGWLHPQPTSNTLHDVHTLGPSTAVAIDNRGGIFRTTDGGQTWIQTHLAPQALAAVAFADDRRGWAVGDEGAILHSSDGGISWGPQPSCSQISLIDVHFISPATGWAVGAGGAVCFTSNGGTSWSSRNTFPSAVLTAVQFLDADNGFIGGYSGPNIVFQTTTDGGQNWESPSGFLNGQLNDLHFADASTGWMAADLGRILHTTDGGQNWQQQYSGGLTRSVGSLHFLDAQNGFAVGGRRRIMRTSDGGANWTLAIPEDASGTIFLNVHFADATSGWAAGTDGGIWSTGDGGATWESRSRRDFAGTVSGVHLAADGRAWVHLPDGLARSLDGGRHWIAQAIPGASVSAVHFLDIDNAWLVGSQGRVWSTADGGDSFSSHHIGSNTNLGAVHFLDDSRGWAGVFVGGDILRTTDGAQTWDRFASGMSILFDVHFASPTRGFIAGKLANSGGLGVSDDGGETWELLPVPAMDELRALHFVDSERGWAVGTQGVIMHTADGGASWVRQTSPTSVALSAVYFLDASRGWVVGVNGTLLTTSDGGQTWALQRLGTGRILQAVHVADAGLGLLGGADATVLGLTDEVDEPSCSGDCDGSGDVTVDEIIGIVNIALGNVALDGCAVADANGDGQVTVDEILLAINNALGGCP